jgi:hypothetical protein
VYSYESRLAVLETETGFDERKDLVAVLEPGKKTRFVRSRSRNIIKRMAECGKISDFSPEREATRGTSVPFNLLVSLMRGEGLQCTFGLPHY